MAIGYGSSQVYNDSSITENIYKYQANGYYVLGQDKYRIDYNNIRSIVIDHDFDNNNMPLIYVIMNLSSKIVDTIIRNKEKGLFILNIQKCIDNSDMPDLWTDYINDTFLYFLTEDINKTDKRDYENANEGREDLYKEITVGMLSQKLVNSNKNTVNGILNCNNMTSAVAYVIGRNRPIVIEPFENNESLKSIFLPPRNSIAKSIEYLNGIRTFYNTQYRYYMDFDVSYLLSSRGKSVPRKGDKIDTVMIILRNDYSSSSKLQGMSIDETNRYYKIEVAATNAEVADYRERSKKYLKLRYTDTAGDNNEYTIKEKQPGDNYTVKTSHVRVPNDNANLLTNAEKFSKLYIAINKTDLDCSVFTINKRYSINADEVYSGCDYSGDYLLRRKRELYYKSTSSTSDSKLTLSTMLYFEKVYE